MEAGALATGGEAWHRGDRLVSPERNDVPYSRNGRRLANGAVSERAGATRNAGERLLAPDDLRHGR